MKRPAAADPVDRARTSAGGSDIQLVLAADRTLLAMERTYAAWVRTGLAALASGAAVRTFIRGSVPPAIADLMASLLIVFSGVCFVAAVWRDLGRFPLRAAPGLPRVPAALLIASSATMALISALALAAVWLVGI